MRNLEAQLRHTQEERNSRSSEMEQLIRRLDARCAALELEQHEQNAANSLLSMHIKNLEIQLDECKDAEMKQQIELTTAQRQVIRLRDALTVKQSGGASGAAATAMSV